MTRLPVAFLALALSCLPSFSKHSLAQAPERMLVQVRCACSDEGGKAYLRALHSRLEASRSFRELHEGEAATEKVIVVEIVSHKLPPEHGGVYSRTALEIVCSHGEDTVHQSVETCNHLPVEACVDSMLSQLTEL